MRSRASVLRPMRTVVALDGLLAAALGATSLAYLSGLLPGMVNSPGVGWSTVGLTVLQTLPLAWRRRAPFAVWFMVTAAAGAWATLRYGESMAYLFAAPFALGNVAANGTRREAAGAAALIVAGFVFLWLVAGANPLSAGVVLAAAMFAVAWSLGDNVRRRRAYTALVEDRAARTERAREEHAQRLVLEERTRIARELHDVVAHHVSLIAVQAETGPYLLEAGSDRAAEGFASIGTTARQALTEMRRLLGVMRETPDNGVGAVAAARTPQPGIGDLGDLVDDAGRTGLRVDLAIRGEARPLPPGVELSAYRIVQEALTNVRKHAPAAHATVAVAYDADALRLRVSNDGTGVGSQGANGNGDGHGLIGMRERAAMLGGRFEAGPQRAGGFAVAATLPLEPPR